MGMSTWSVLASMKWLLLGLVAALGIGKIAVRCASGAVNYFFEAWLRWRPLCFSYRGAIYNLRGLRAGSIEVDLLYGWARSGGRLPYLAIVVKGLELRLEAFRSRGSIVGVTGPPVDAFTRSPSPEGETGRLSPFWAHIVLRMVGWYSATVLDTRILTEFHAGGGGMESVEGGESLSPSAVITTEVFVSFFEACTKQLDDASGGVKLVVRVVQDADHVIVHPSTNSPGGGATLQGAVSLEVEVVPPRGKRLPASSPALVLRSASVSSGAPWQVVVGERDIEAFATLIPAPLASPAADTPRAPSEANPPGSGDAGFVMASASASARSSKPGAVLDPPLASLFSLLSPRFRFDTSFEGIRLEVLEGEGAEAVDAEGGVTSCLESCEGDPGVDRPAACKNTRGRGGGGAKGIFATPGCWEESDRSGCSKVSRQEAGVSAVTEIKGVQLSLALDSVVAGEDVQEDVAGKERKKVSFSVKWSSAVLAAGKSFPLNEAQAQSFSHHVSSSVESLSLGLSRSVENFVDPVDRGDGGDGAWAKRGARRTCLPIHLGKLSCSGETVVDFSGPSVEIDVSGRLAFFRLTMSREGLSVLLWLAALGRRVPLSSMPSSRPPSRSNSLRSPQNLAKGHGTPLVAGRGTGIRRRVRVSYTVSFRVDRAFVGLAGDDDQVFEGRPGPARAADDGGDGWGSRRRDWSARSSSSTVEDSPTGSGVMDGEDARADAAADSCGNSSSSRGYLKERRTSASLVRVIIPRIAIRASSSQLTTAPPEASVADGAAHDVGPKISVVARWLEGHLEMDDPGTSAIVPQSPPLNGEACSVMPTSVDSTRGDSSSPSPSGVGDDSRQSARPVTHRLRWLAVRKLSFESGVTRAAEGSADDAVSKEASATTRSLDVSDGGREGPSRPGVGLAAEGVWAEWTPALFFLLGKSAITIKSCLTKSGVVHPPDSASSLRYDPLNHWSPPSPSPPPHGVDPRGPAPGFPGVKLSLQPVREPLRVDACLSNKVFVESPATSLLWGGGHRASPMSPSGGEVNDEGGGAGAARRDLPGNFSATGDGRIGRNDGGARSAGVPKVLAVSARDVRVEFPYQRGVCSGDMERGDIIRWLRRFCGFGFQGEYGFPATQRKCSRFFCSEGEGVVKDVGGGASWSCQFIEARDFDLSVVTVGDAAGVSISGQGSGSGVLPQLSCALSGVSVSTAGYYPSSADTDGGTPGLHGSAESGAEISPRSKGTRDSASPSWAAPSPPGRQGFTVPSVSLARRTVTPVTVARRAGLDVYGGRHSIRRHAPVGEDETRPGTAAATATSMKDSEGASGSSFSLSESNGRRTALVRTPSSMLGVFLGGTRHCANTRQKILQVSRFAVLKMASDGGAEISGDDEKGGSSARVVDIFAEGVTGDWSPSTHLHIIKPVRDVTLSVWKLMLHLRRAGLPEPVGLSGATGQNAFFRWNRTPPLEDSAALEYWLRAWAAGGSSGPAGDTLHRLHVRDVALRGRWPAQPDLSATAPSDAVPNSSSAEGFASATSLFPGRSAEDDAVRVQVEVDEFSSESVGEHFSFSNTAVDLDGDRLASVASFDITRTLAQGQNASDLSSEAATPPVDPADRLIVGACFHELKARALALDGDNWGAGEGERWSRVREHSKSTATSRAGGRPPEAWLMPLVTRPEGFMIEIEGVVVRAERGKELGNRLDCLAVQFRALTRALAELPGRWHPLKGGPCDDFHRLFWKPPVPEEVFVASSTRPQDRAWGTHIWLRAREVSVEFADDPLETWLEAMLPVWSKELATRAFRHALRRRRRCLSGSGKDREQDTRSYMQHVREAFGERGPPPAFPSPETTRKEASRSKAGGDMCESSPSLMRTRVGSVSVDVTPPSSGEILCRGLLERLDQHPPPVGTEFGTIARISYAARCTDISVHLRRVENPTFSCEAVTAAGDAMGVWVRAPSSLIGCTPVVLEELPAPWDSAAAAVAAPRAERGVSGAGLSAQVPMQVPMKAARQGGEGVELGGTIAADVVTILTRDFPPKVFLDLTVVLEKPRFEFSPAHSYALVDVANAAKLLLPPGVFSQLESERKGRHLPRPRAASPAEAVATVAGGEASVSPLAPWDVGRCMVHGKFDVTLVGGIALMIAGTETTPPTTRLPSRKFLAAAAAAEAAAAAADTAPGSSDATTEAIRRGSFPPPAARSTTASAGVVGDAGGLSTGSRLSWRWRDRGTNVGNAFPEAGAKTGGLGRPGGIPGAGSPSTLPDVSELSDASGGVRGSYSESVGSQHSGGAGSIHGVNNFSAGGRLRELKPSKVLAVSCVVLKLKWAGAGRLELEATGIEAKVFPPPASGLPPLLEVPSLRCAIVSAWQTLGGPSPDHWVYVRRPSAQTSESLMPPSKVQTSKSKSQPIQVVDSPSSGGAYEGVSDTGEEEFPETSTGSGCRDPFELFRARGVSFQVSVSLPNRPTGGDPPSLPAGVELPEALLSCLPSRMCVSVYGCCLEWAMEWSTCFSRLPPVPPPRSRLTANRGRGISAGCKSSKASSFTSYSSGSSIGSNIGNSANIGSRTSAALKRRPNLPLSAKRLPGNPEAIDRGKVVSAKGPPESFADLVQGLRLGPVSLSEMDASLYDTAPENVNKRGIRVSIRGGAKMSLCFSVEKSDAIDPFTTGRVVIPTTGSMVITTVHGLRLTTGKVEARLCDRHTGSRGAVFLRLDQVTLEQGGTGGRGNLVKEALPEKSIPCERPRGPLEARKRPSGGGSSSDAKDSESNILGAGRIERIGEAGSVVRAESAADEFVTTFDPELEDGSGGGGDDSRCRVVETDRRFWEERVKLSKKGSSDVYVHRGDEGDRSSRRRSSSGSSGGAEGFYQELDAEGLLQRSALSSPASPSEERRARLENPDCEVLPRALPFFFVGDSDAADVELDVAGSFGASDTTKPLARTRSARIWASRGGVPPDLDLLPSQEFVEGLARLGEGSGDEDFQDDGDNDGEGESHRSASSSGETGADRSGLEREGVSPDGALGSREAGAVHNTEEVVGSGMWDKELDAITRAAWLRSKQASRRRIFSSNASSTASAEAACASRSRADFSRESGAPLPRHAPPPTAGIPRFSGRRGPPSPALRPQRFPPSPIYGDSNADVGGSLAGMRESAAGGRARGGGGESRENKLGEGHRVAGSGFLYRVVFDGLKVLVTLRVRDSLLLLAQSGMDVAFAAIPGLSNPSKALLAKEVGGDLLRGETKKRTSLDLQQFIDKPLALPGKRRESGSLTPYSKAERQSQDSVESLVSGRSSNPGGAASGRGAAIGISGGAGDGPVMHQLFSIELRRTQIQLLGAEIAKASLLFSMELAVVQGWVGLDPLEEASASGRDTHTQQEDVVESSKLQSLAQRLLTTFREAVTVGLEGTMLSAAPSDVDVDAGVQWLPKAAFETKPATRLSQTSPGARKKQPRPHAPPLSPRPSHAEAQALLLRPSASASAPAANPSRAGDLGLDTTSEEVVAANPSAALVSVDFDGSYPRLRPDASPAAREAGTTAESMKDGGSAIGVGHLFPTSPMSMRSVASWSAGVGRDSVGTGRWGVEASSGVLAAESPSRAKEHAARKILLREVGDASGVAAVLTGKTAALSRGGMSEDHAGLRQRKGPIERKYFAQHAVVVPRGRAVFKPVVKRIDSLEMQVLAHHGAVENNVIKIDLPSIKAALTSLQLKLVATVISEVLASPLPKLRMLKMHRGSFSNVPATNLHDPHEETPSVREGKGWTGIGLSRSSVPTVTDAWKSKRREEWKTLELCRLQHFISEASQHTGKRWSGYAPLESGSARKAAVEAYGGALEHGRGEGVDAALWRLASVVEAEAADCARRSLSVSDRLTRAVKALKLKLQQRPNTHLSLHLKRLRLELWRDESSSPFLRAEVRRIAADVMVYDDSSGSLDLQVGSLWASQLRGTGDAEGTPPKKTEGAANVSSEWWRAGGAGGEAAIMALEVIKPLMPQDLERLPDQGSMRGWTPRDITIHVQAQLGTPIGDMTLVRHFEAAVFPLVLYLRRSLFADLWSFSSEAVSALASGGAGPDPGATLREEQLKASFLVSRKTGAKGNKSGLGRTRLRRGWRAGKGSTAASTPNAEESVTPRDTNRSRKTPRSAGTGADGSGGGPPSPRDHDHDHDSASDAGNSDGEEAIDSGHPPSPASHMPSKEEQAAPGLMGKLMAVKHLRLGEVNIFLTYTGDRYLELEDVDNVHLKLHPLVYTNKKWTPRKLMLKIRRDACLDVLSQVSRNFNNLGSFLNTRLVPKSGASSAYPSLGSTGGTQRGSQHGSGTSAREKATKLWRSIPSPATGRNRGRPFSPTFLSHTFHAVSRSISPVPARDRAGSALFVGEQGGGAEARTSERSPGVGGEAAAGKGHRKAWSGSKHTGPRPGPSPSTAPRGVSELDDDAGLTIGAAAAAVAFRAGGGEEALSDSELVGGVLSPSRDSDDEGEIRLKAEEQNAKVLLFGRHLGGGTASSSGSATNRPADTMSRMNRSARSRGKLLARLAFTRDGKRSGRDGSGGDVADGQG